MGVLRIGAPAVGLGAAIGIHAGTSDRELAIVLSALSAVTLASSLAATLRRRREQVLAAVRSVAEAAQHAFLKPVPATVGPFQAAVRYSAAAAEARIGGDLYALVPTPTASGSSSATYAAKDCRRSASPPWSWVSSGRRPTTSRISSMSSTASNGAWRATSARTTSSPR